LHKRVNKEARGNDITPEELKNYITSLVSKEDLKQPLSDESLRSLLSTKYLVKVARRTVTKYREEAGIGSSRARKIN
jgi:DNA-directed RNA polymerase specialized sigma subunit, sigma54 homolog